MTLSGYAFRVALAAAVSSLIVSATLIMNPVPSARADDSDPGSTGGWDYCLPPTGPQIAGPGARSGAMSGCSVSFNGTGLSTSTNCRGEYDYTCPEGLYICVYNFGPNSSMCGGGGSGPGGILE